MAKTRDYRLVWIKFLACILVIVLHGMKPGQNLQEYIYLLGSYGVPLFFLVNGYLRSHRITDWAVLKKNTVRFVGFALLWAALTSALHLLKERRFVFFSYLFGAFLGKERLVHFWFFFALLVIYAIAALLTALLGDDRLKALAAKPQTAYLVILLMTLSFTANLLLKRYAGMEIKELIPAPFRVITNGGFFVLGMHQALREKTKPSVNNWVLLALAPLCTLLLWLAAKRTGIVWASSYYASLPVILYGILFLDSFRVGERLLKAAVLRTVIGTSTGVWILHPFVLTGLDRIEALLQIGKTVPVSLGNILAALVLSVAVTLVLQRIKGLRMLVSP